MAQMYTSTITKGPKRIVDPSTAFSTQSDQVDLEFGLSKFLNPFTYMYSVHAWTKVAKWTSVF